MDGSGAGDNLQIVSPFQEPVLEPQRDGARHAASLELGGRGQARRRAVGQQQRQDDQQRQ